MLLSLANSAREKAPAVHVFSLAATDYNSTSQQLPSTNAGVLEHSKHLILRILQQAYNNILFIPTSSSLEVIWITRFLSLVGRRFKMPEHDALIAQYSHLNKFSREKEALHALKKIASLVKPIMRARSWTVGTLAEFYPNEHNLLGINQNRGQKICLRLRYPGDQNQFLPLEQVIDTMLHELCHNVHGPHNADFHALWDQLRKEYEGLLSKGYTGEGFLSDGHKLGGRRVPMHEARRIARIAAEKRQTLHSGSGQKLGGRPLAAGTDIRRVIVDAIERRNTVTKGCGGGGNKSEKVIIDLVDEATNNGFRTKAEEDEANERAIAQALWELVQEDEKKEYGEAYIPPTAMNPTGNGGGEIGPHRTIKKEEDVVQPRSKAPPVRQYPDRPVSRLVSESVAKRPKTMAKKEATLPSSSSSSPSFSTTIRTPSLGSVPASKTASPSPTGWTCQICTLHNPINYLTCDACTVERPAEITKKLVEAEKKKALPPQPIGMWNCSRCDTMVEDKWWSCYNCGKVKESS